jgi:hypothetical protein
MKKIPGCARCQRSACCFALSSTVPCPGQRAQRNQGTGRAESLSGTGLHAVRNDRQARADHRLRSRFGGADGQGAGRGKLELSQHRLGRHHPGAGHQQVRHHHERHDHHRRTQAETIDFSEPYMLIGQTVCCARNWLSKIKSYKDLNKPKYKIASKLGTTGEIAAKKYIPRPISSPTKPRRKG